MEKVTVAYSSSNAYAFLTGTSILSLYENNKDIKELDVFIFDTGIEQENVQKLNSIAEAYGRGITYIKMEPYIDKLRAHGMTAYNGSFATCMKLLITEYFPENIDRVLYIDSDTIVRGSIDELWKFDMKNNCIGMTIDCMNSKLKEGYGVAKDKKYCSGALVLYDLKSYREKGYTERILTFLKENTINFPFVEQDVLSVCFCDEISILPMQYNFISLYEKFSVQEIYHMYNLNDKIFYNETEYNNAKENPIIVHFPSVYISRPWYTDCISGWMDEYDKYLYADGNPFNTYVKEESNMGRMKKLQKFMYIHMNKCFYIRVQRWASNYLNYRVVKQATGK